MGQTGSKESPAANQHVFKAEGPVSFSNELMQSLQSSSQSDTTRAKQIELHIQNRVAAELEKLQSQASSALKSAQESISKEEPSADSSSSLTEKLSDAVTSKSTLDEKERQKNMSSNTVSKEIDQLRKTLDARKKLEKPDEAVEKTKESLVHCLRVNDRRPLDCWQEVEAFKKEVGRLERDFVERTVR
ncbi:DUF1690-domain-containing protein [Pseudovirgaria hyperparasitica]|uniref:DUF1690-domain-containing protein n=1 Tax=Pseudovirgaria hyperparasitica TaxID=470096 RepID=A0A6A6VT90_9PEZI|nr:DUF1690-domain-containing protein [Pseudovirgaria hyperparasitica]KAF2753365.1 DUF1690-domain-containing protein [Pseudovirgaria hyperparasitica]